MPDLSQEGRVGKLTTPAGEDIFVLNRFEGTEMLGGMYEFRIGALSPRDNYDLDSMIGKNCNVTITAVDQLERHFNGVLTEANYTGEQYNLAGYQLVLRPWLHLLSRTSDCRIFNNKKPNKIITQVFSDRGFTDFRENLSEDYPELEYVVQYRETDLNFVCRMMEQFGMYYYFEHEASKHTLVLCDGPNAHNKVPSLKPVPLRASTQESRRDEQQFDTWNTSRSLQTGKGAVNSFSIQQMNKDVLGKADKHGQYNHASLEIYDYDGNHGWKDLNEKFAKVRVEAVQALDNRRIAVGAAPSLTPGYKFTHENNTAQDDNKDYVVLKCTHSYADQTYTSGGGSPVAYAGTYEMMAGDRQFRSLLTTPRPVIHGWQSAVVAADTGNDSEEIDVDKYGRVLVQFPWDRKKDLSRRVRVVQSWAGKTRGAWFCPRVGDEVIVAYDDGNPNRPLVVGSVYNGDLPVPMPLPSKKTQSGVLTKSSKSSDGYHMLMFDDTVGQERIKLRSQRDLMFKALNNEQRDILMSQTENVGKDETINVGMDMAKDISKGGGNWALNAFKTATITVGMKDMMHTQIAMTTSEIKLTAAMAPGVETTITLNPMGIKFDVFPHLTTHEWNVAMSDLKSVMVKETGMAMIDMTAPMVSAKATLMTPALVAGGAVVGGVPI